MSWSLLQLLLQTPLLEAALPAAGGAPSPSPDRQEYTVDGSALSFPLHSIGAQSTAGTARLLQDYPADQRSDVLDLLFLPNFGASLQHLKVELGGDSQISCGAEASPMRSEDPADDDFNRGYDWWLMKDAKRRNPDIVLLGLVYAW